MSNPLVTMLVKQLLPLVKKDIGKIDTAVFERLHSFPKEENRIPAIVTIPVGDSVLVLETTLPADLDIEPISSQTPSELITGLIKKFQE